MDWYVKAFIKASLAWLAFGVTVALAMVVHPAWLMYRLVHMHAMLLGFVSMMIFGVAYHVLPRFAGHPLHSRRAAVVHWWLANAGLAMLLVGFAMRATNVRAWMLPLGAGGLSAAAGAYLFAYLMWRTIDGRSARRTTAGAAAGQSSPPVNIIQVRRKPITSS